jgi:tetratricopeptide (TPR) repeat protein
VLFAELQASQAERLKRNETPFRLAEQPFKRELAASRQQLLADDERHQLDSRGARDHLPDYLRLETTALSAQEAATRITSGSGWARRQGGAASHDCALDDLSERPLRSRPMIRAWVLSLVGAWLLLGTPAFAENRKKAKAFFESGMQHYNLGEHEQALDDFKSAYREYEDASFLFNIAQCQRALGKKEDAVRSYRSFVRESKNLTPETRGKVDEIVAALESSIRDEAATKARLDAANAAAAEAAAAAAAKQSAAEATTVVATPAPPPKKPLYKRWWLWTAVGGGVVAIALGVGLGVGLTHRTIVTYPSPPTPPAGGVLPF